MPVDSGGNATRPASPIPVSGQTADAPQVNVPVDDIYAILNMLAFLDGRKPLRGDIQLNGYRARGGANAEQPQDYVTLSQLQEIIGSSRIPVGSLQAYTISSSSAPPGWVFANGQTLQRSVFPNLWYAVQEGNNLAASESVKTHGQYGPGDGVSTFTVPNISSDGGYFIRPLSGGRSIGSVQADEFKNHKHSGVTEGGGVHSHAIPGEILNGNGSRGVPGPDGNLGNWFKSGSSTSSSGDHAHDFNTNETGGSETRPKNIAYPVIIKA